MADGNAGSAESLFRVNKRRKIFRRRAEADYDRDVEDGQETETPVTLTAVSGWDAGLELPQDDTAATIASTGSVLHAHRKANSKRHGIGFTSTSGPKSADQPVTINEETALVPISPGRQQEPVQIERFTKPTGRASVVEDKHMVAYIDSKLAELRSSTSTPTTTTSTTATQAPAQTRIDVPRSEAAHPSDRPITLPTGQTRTGRSEVEEIDLKARPNPGSHNPRRAVAHTKPTKPRRRPRAPDPETLARDAMVDQIMRESFVPLYSQPNAAGGSSQGNPTNAAANALTTAAAADSDTAVAEAFKASFLADMEEQSRLRRAPAAPKKAAVTSSHGPKLGGSRSQREKMRAAVAEERKGKAGKR